MHAEHRRRNLRWAAVVATALVLTTVPNLPAVAAVHAVDCSAPGDDIAAVQNAVDGAASGDTIALSGTCDFSRALPHGGGVASIDATAVLVRPGSPVTDLTITSAGSSLSATIVGTGSQTAFAVAPGNDRVTITGLRFVNLARPIVVAGAQGATIGAPGGTPNSGANRIFGHATMDSAILALSGGVPFTVSYGAMGMAGTANVTPTSLADLSVVGNYISYAPPGTGGPDTDVVAIDVRQTAGGDVQGVSIAENAVGMFTSDLASFTHNSIRVEGSVPAVAVGEPDVSSYSIRDVSVTDNNLGRFEELDPGDLPSGVDPGDIHSGGRAAVVLLGVGGYDVTGNDVRARVTGTGSAPGGGIVASDSSFGTISGNAVQVASDDTAKDADDLGAIAVIKDAAVFTGGASSVGNTTHDIDITDNLIGPAPFGARKGIAMSGADLVTVWGNESVHTSAATIYFGLATEGPSGNDGPAITKTVTRSVACSNVLEGVTDDPEQVFIRAASPPSTGNAFPGGSRQDAPGNAECTPTITLSPPIASSGDDLVAQGTAWAARPVDLVVTDDNGDTVSISGTTGDDARYLLTVPSTTLANLSDGVITGIVVARDPSGLERASLPTSALKDYVDDNPDVGTVFINDVDGYTNHDEVFLGTKVAWTAPTTSVTNAIIWWSKADGTIPSSTCGYYTAPIEGESTLPFSCASALKEGEYHFNVRWQRSDGEVSAIVSDSSILDTVAAAPVIVSPAEQATVKTSAVPVSGTGEAGALVTVRRSTGNGTYADMATATVAGDGSWSVTINFADGAHQITAHQVDVAGNQSGSAPARIFTVDSTPPDVTPPPDPVITHPLGGSLQPASFSVYGTGEPFSYAGIFEGTTFLGSGQADGNGLWVAGVSLPGGMHTIHAVSFDAAGNASGPSASVTVEVDASPPSLQISTQQDQVFLLDAVTIEGSAGDDRGVGLVVAEFFDSSGSRKGPIEAVCTPACPGVGVTSGPTSVEWSVEAGMLRPGFVTVRVTAYDVAGNATVRQQRIIAVSP